MLRQMLSWRLNDVVAQSWVQKFTVTSSPAAPAFLAICVKQHAAAPRSHHLPTPDRQPALSCIIQLYIRCVRFQLRLQAGDQVESS